MSPHDRDRLVGKTIAKVEYMAPDMADNTNQGSELYTKLEGG